MDNIFVNFLELPSKVRSFVIANCDNTYTVVLNSKHSHEQHLISYQHEVEHILRGDYDKKCSADLIEINAH